MFVYKPAEYDPGDEEAEMDDHAVTDTGQCSYEHLQEEGCALQKEIVFYACIGSDNTTFSCPQRL